MKARTSRSESVLESGFSEDLGGAGVIGDSIGTTTTQFIITTGTTRGAGRFTTGTISTEEEARGAPGDFVAVLTQGIGLQTPGAGEFTTVREQRIGLSTETAELEGMGNPTARAEPARA